MKRVEMMEVGDNAESSAFGAFDQKLTVTDVDSRFNRCEMVNSVGGKFVLRLSAFKWDTRRKVWVEK